MSSLACPTEDALLAFVQGFVRPAEGDAIEAHLDSCTGCTGLVAEAARELVGPGSVPAEQGRPLSKVLSPGYKLGRYSILEMVGRGAMGAVYAAYDPKLDRRVAIKVLRPASRGGAPAVELQQRLLREAQAMARVSHPNVLPIYDVGTFEDGVFLALEFASGGTLRRWLDDKPAREWSEVLSVFRLAGAGLIAAHRAGIVHRDFKPDNVMLDESGRVFITDFGVAYRGAETRSSPALGTGERTLLPSLSINGALVGTPAYMAPEQLNGGEADARSDQFAFAASLYEGLYKVHPFPLESVAALREAVSAGRVREPPRSAKVPAWVEAAVLRGLQADPSRRFASMDELLAALDDPPRRQRLLIPIGLAAAVLGAIGFFAFRTSERRQLACERGDGSIDRLWSASDQSAVEDAFLKTGAAFAPGAWARVSASMGAYVLALKAARSDACAASHQRADQSELLFDRRMQCLDERLQDTAALIAQLRTADAAAVEKSVTAFDRIVPLSSCADRRRLLDAAPLPQDSAARERIAAARSLVARLAALDESGRYEQGVSESAAAVESARATGYAPVEAEALYQRAQLLGHATDHKDAEPVLIEATAAAIRGHRDDLAAMAQARLVGLLGSAQRTDEALRWDALARATIARGGDDPLLLASLLDNRGAMESFAFHHEHALASHQEALALLEKALGPDHPRTAEALSQVAHAQYFLQHYEEALALGRRVLDLSVRLRGELHPLTALALLRVGMCLEGLGRYQEALDFERRALEVRRKALGPEHGDLARAYGAIGHVLTLLGRYSEANAAFDDSLAIAEKRFGPDSFVMLANLVSSASPLALSGDVPGAEARLSRAEAIVDKMATNDKSGSDGNRGLNEAMRADVIEMAGRYSEAASHYARCRTLLEKAAPELGDIAHCKSGQARQLLREGIASAAAALQGEALAQLEKDLGGNSAELAEPLMGQSDALLATGDLNGAAVAAQRVLHLIEGKEMDPLARAELQLAAAQTLVRRPETHERGAALGVSARALLGSRGWLPARVRERVLDWDRILAGASVSSLRSSALPHVRP